MSSPIPITSKEKRPLPHELLVMYRQRSKLTQLQLASLLGFKGERMVQLWEGGYNLPKAARLKKLIEVYLERSVFVLGQERYEARELWAAVKNLAEATSLNFETYPIFDDGWFNDFLKNREEEPAFTLRPETSQAPQKTLTAAREAKSKSRSVNGETTPAPIGVSGLVPNNLPAPANPFIGRIQEIRAVCDLVRQGDLRLVTLTGPGGVGKTRLALQIASELLGSFKDGIWLVELAPHSDPRLIPELTAKVLDIREEPGRSLDKALADYLQSKDTVLLLDNCEHLLETCAGFASELLRACPRLHIIATSREALGLDSECIWRVEPLPVETLDFKEASASPQAPGQSEAVRLFLARARAVNPAFAPGSEEISSVGRICVLLEGIPLAIELAAARVKILSTGQILERLMGAFEHRLGLLGGTNRYSLPRHQTLKASLDWSYNLLPDDERSLFRRLCFFAGSWSLEAAEEVCGGTGTLDNLMRLVDKSLVQVLDGWEQPVRDRDSDKDQENLGAARYRYRMLETVRQYARLRLEEAGEFDTTGERHLDFFVKMTEEIEPETREGGPGWLPKLEIEHPNIRVALEWALDRETNHYPKPETNKDKDNGPLVEILPASRPSLEHAQKALRLASALNLFWNEGGYITEGREWLDRTARADTFSEVSDEQSLRVKAKALKVMGTLASLQGEPETGLRYLEGSLQLYREIQDKGEVAALLYSLGGAAWMHGANNRAGRYYEEALLLYRKLDDKSGLGFTLNGLGASSTYLGNYEKAAACLEEALLLNRTLGNKSSIAVSLAELGVLAWTQGDMETAREQLEKCLFIQKELRNNLGTALALLDLAMVAWIERDYGRLVRLVEEGQVLLENWRTSFFAGSFPLYLGLSCLDQGDYKQANEYLQESWELFKQKDDQRGMPLALEGQAFLLSRLGKVEQATRFLGAAEAFRERTGYPVFPVLKERYQKEIEHLRKLLGPEIFDKEWKMGEHSF